MTEIFNLYIYRHCLGKKHRGIEQRFADDNQSLARMWQTIRKQSENLDVCEIRVTDGDDFLNIHWTEETGLIFPDVPEEVKAVFRSRVK